MATMAVPQKRDLDKRMKVNGNNSGYYAGYCSSSAVVTEEKRQ